jgi:hypothetical protein
MARSKHMGMLVVMRMRARLISSTAVLIAFALLAGTAPLARPVSAIVAISGFHLPFKYNDDHKVTQGWNTTYSHNGKDAYAYDFSMPEGTPIVAAAPGKVTYTHSGETNCGGQAFINDANYVVISHNLDSNVTTDNMATQYAHLKTVSVSVGQLVDAGQQIGTSGKTGWTDCGAHLHFASQALGGAFTQSQPIYFEEYPAREFVAGDIVTSKNPECKQTSSGMPSGSFCGVYFRDIFKDNVEYFARKEAPLDFSWSVGPGGYWLNNVSSFSARWVGHWSLFPDVWKFTLKTSDGIRLYVDGVKKYDSWFDRTTPATFTTYVNVTTSGEHEIKVEYYNKGSSPTVSVHWTPCSKGC